MLLVLSAPAASFVGPETRRGDLDGDGQRETVRTVRVDLPGVEDMFDRTAIRVSDTCPGGREVEERIAGPQDNLALLRLRAADTRPGEEVFVDLRSGAAGRLGEARVVAWRRRAGFPCRRARQLFRYLTDRHTRTPAGGTGDISSFRVRLRDVSRRYRGLEVALDERFLRRSDPQCCGSIKKVTYWRYSRGRDRYVRYRTRVVRS